MTGSPIRIAFVGTFPPTPCGIATFTESLRDAVVHAGEADAPLGDSRSIVSAGVIRLVDEPSRSVPDGVVLEWTRGNRQSGQMAVQVANSYDCVIMQHEFGIYGGDDGEDVVEFVAACSVPVIVVLHTVVPSPSANQKHIVEQIIDGSEIAIVQTECARQRLLSQHDVDESRVRVIPHGATANFDGPAQDHPAGDGSVLLTWGLLGPGKGIEHAIRAVALLEGRGVPTPTYIVAGSTHPNVVAREGESYRNCLRALADELGIGDRVVFDDSYRGWSSLRAMVRGADVVVLPYDSRDQVTSGVLVEALASAQPIVATNFPHAAEALRAGAGVVVAHEDPEAMADALAQILGDPILREQMRAVARAEAASLLWPRVGERYLALAQASIDSRDLIEA